MNNYRQLASLLGLDDETVSTQIWPLLSGLKSPGEVKDYLHTLLGPGQAQQSFITSYLSARFPQAQAQAPPPPTAAAARSTSTPWGKATSSSSASSSRLPPSQPAQPSRAPVSEADRSALERAFGGGGKVYVKNRDDEWGLGGGGAGGKGKKAGGGKGSANGSGTVTPTTSAVPTSTTSTLRPPPTTSAIAPPPHPPSAAESTSRPLHPPPIKPAPSSNSNSKKKEPAPADVSIDLSSEAASELLQIDRELSSLEGKGKSVSRECFCAARQHPLSPLTPLCPKCGLILCLLNSPISPCPSCSFHPLLSPLTTKTLRQNLLSRRESILANETARLQRLKEEEERERRALKFPTLGGGGDNKKNTPQPRAYSSIAGAGPGLDAQITKAYETGISVNGNKFGTGLKDGEPAKVLRLDTKTKKVKVVTKVPVKGKVREEVKTVEEEVWEDGMVGWVDEKDDGVRIKELVKRKNKEKDDEGLVVERANDRFQNDLSTFYQLSPADSKRLRHTLSPLPINASPPLTSPFANPSFPVTYIDPPAVVEEEVTPTVVGAGVPGGGKKVVPGMAVEDKEKGKKKRRGKGKKEKEDGDGGKEERGKEVVEA